jgi:hypothetical protein
VHVLDHQAVNAAVAVEGGLAHGEFRQRFDAERGGRRARQRADVDDADDGLRICEQV